MKASTLATTIVALTLCSCTQPPQPPQPPPPPPNGTWTLVWCGGISWAGCGTGASYIYPDKASCYEALAAMHTGGDQPIAESGLKRNTVALCRPAVAGDGA